MKQPVKLTQHELRSIIKEAIQGKRPGEPEPFAEGDYSPVVSLDMTSRLEALVDEWAAEAKEMYSKEDPSMSSRDEWDDQVSRAAGELVKRILQNISDVEESLIGGDFSNAEIR